MFVYSVKSSKIKMVILVLLVVLLVLAMLLVTRLHQPAEADSVLNIKAENAEQRVAFLSQFGWSFDEDPVEVAEVIIPPEFDEVYEKYNAIQKEQGFDLTKYQGKRVKRWTYAIKNYPGYAADSGCIHANLLVYEGQVIGGDVCSVELNGFMHGFDYPTDTSTRKPLRNPAPVFQKQPPVKPTPHNGSPDFTTAFSK